MTELDTRIGFVEAGYSHMIEIGGEEDQAAADRALGEELEKRDAMRLQIVQALQQHQQVTAPNNPETKCEVKKELRPADLLRGSGLANWALVTLLEMIDLVQPVSGVELTAKGLTPG